MEGSTLTFIAAVRRFYEEVFNKKNVAAINDFLASHGIDRALPPSRPSGIEGSKQFVRCT